MSRLGEATTRRAGEEVGQDTRAAPIVTSVLHSVHKRQLPVRGELDGERTTTTKQESDRRERLGRDKS